MIVNTICNVNDDGLECERRETVASIDNKYVCKIAAVEVCISDVNIFIIEVMSTFISNTMKTISCKH